MMQPLFAHGARLFRYGISGLLSLGIYVGLLHFLHRTLDVPLVLLTGLSFIVATACNYLLHFHFTFRSARSHSTATWRFLAVVALGLALNAWIVPLLVHHFAFEPATAGLIFGLAWPLISYLLLKRAVF